MKRRQLALFEPPARKPRQKLMHVIDAGHNGPGPGLNAQFKCARCSHTSEWMPVQLTAAKRGIPCPKCNGGT
jgi:DNA-directed RNA polymerase subunit RPC12/RpoP